LLQTLSYVTIIVVASNRSQSGSNQPEHLSLEFPGAEGQSTVKAKVKPKAKAKAKQNAKKKTTIPMQPLDSPAMGTRSKKSKKMDPASPAMSTRSKRRLSL